MSNAPIDEGELRRRFQMVGDIKSVRHVDGRPECVTLLRSHRLLNPCTVSAMLSFLTQE
jgi:hypothetical protein